jgi:hypothetical protein
VIGRIDTTGFVVACYVFAGVVVLVTGFTERHRRRSDTSRALWPTFWFATGGLLIVMAAGRATNASDLLVDLGRDTARSEGWYDIRRSVQAWVIGVVTLLWAATVAVAIWRVPERRRRYLPAAVAAFTLVCYVGVRMVSLHQVDAVLYRHEIVGVRYGTTIEVSLLLVVIATAAWRLRVSTSVPPLHDGSPGSMMAA